MAVYKVEFEPVKRNGKCYDNESLLDCARKAGVGISSICGGHGTCHACKIKILSGSASEPTSREKEAFKTDELKNGWRLACQAFPNSDVKVYVPLESLTTLQRLQVEGMETVVKPEPMVSAFNIQLAEPSLTDLRADADRLLDTLNAQYNLNYHSIDFDVLRHLSASLRRWDWHCKIIVRNNEIISVRPEKGRLLGLAVDLGTTKIAGYLVDLNSGQTLASAGIMNPQVNYGEDIISRITNIIRSPDAGLQLQKVVVDAINELADDLCKNVESDREDIADAVVVGNTAMHHIFLNLAVKQLAVAPFVPAIQRSLDVRTREIGLKIAEGAYVHLLPNIAGFVGADHVAMLLAVNASEIDGPVIALDIGTNTEVSLVNRGKMTSVSCASGPAFEGAHIKNGMRAAKGAIERVRISKDIIQYETIDKAPPVGICGSGILDAIAQLYINNIIDESGRLNEGNPRVKYSDNQREFLLVDTTETTRRAPVVITQQDIREVQLAKAAIRTGIQVLLEGSGFEDTDLKQIIIAGAFGTYIDISSAITIGMLPSLPLEKFKQVGNAAGMGAKMALLSQKIRGEAEKIAENVRYIELASAPNFMNTFMQASYLGKYRLKNGKREII